MCSALSTYRSARAAYSAMSALVIWMLWQASTARKQEHTKAAEEDKPEPGWRAEVEARDGVKGMECCLA